MADSAAPETLPPSSGAAVRSYRAWRLVPLLIVLGLTALAFWSGLHRGLSLETLVRHQAAIDAAVDRHIFVALGAFVLLYVVVVALSIPGSLVLTVTGGILFGGLAGGGATVIGATLGATIIFLVARSAVGEHLVRRAGPGAQRVAEGFREDAFSYLLFLRLVPLFPFFLVNLVPALAGVRLGTFVAATILGILPATFTFSFVGAGLDSVIAAQAAKYQACLAAGGRDCHLDFDLKTILTPDLLLALAAVGILALLPVLVKRVRARRGLPDRSR
jgi:uncharacterized membrane protein YdjX (TVP38/TMEM64 family)